LEARFVEEHQVGIAVEGRIGDAGKRLLLPAAYALLVPLLGLGLGLLASPAQAAFEDLADMLGVIGDAELAADDFGDPGGGPQVGGPAVAGGAWQEKGVRPTNRVVAQAGAGSRGEGVKTADRGSWPAGTILAVLP
jgi:hypothetical protein